MKENEDARRYLTQHWVHSVEDDTETEMVYRPATFEFPPLKTRTGFRESYEFRSDGKCSVVGIARADGSESGDCEWELQENGGLKIVIRFEDGELGTLSVKIIEKHKLILSTK